MLELTLFYLFFYNCFYLISRKQFLWFVDLCFWSFLNYFYLLFTYSRNHPAVFLSFTCNWLSDFNWTLWRRSLNHRVINLLAWLIILIFCTPVSFGLWNYCRTWASSKCYTFVFLSWQHRSIPSTNAIPLWITPKTPELLRILPPSFHLNRIINWHSQMTIVLMVHLHFKFGIIISKATFLSVCCDVLLLNSCLCYWHLFHLLSSAFLIWNQFIIA